MVRLINQKNLEKIGKLLLLFFKFQRNFTFIHEVNNRELKPCIYAMWHAHQFCIFGLKDKANTNVLISTSADGQIVSNGVEMLGFKTVRGSTGRKGAVGGTMQIIDRLKNNECVTIMVDGPRGPARKVKGGVIKIAKLTGVPIVPVVWYSNQINFINLPSWDKMSSPVGPTRLVNLYGEPIIVPPDLDDAMDNEYKMQLQKSLEDLEKEIPSVYEAAVKAKVWNKTKK